MTVAVDSALAPRKKPSQQRSSVTVDAILEATVRVLLVRGQQGLTTKEVAEVAGVSVGSLYQYFPNKQALLAELIRRSAEESTENLIEACNRGGDTLPDSIRAVISGCMRYKRENLARSIAIQGPMADLGGRTIVMTAVLRLMGTFSAMLEQVIGRPLTPDERARLSITIFAIDGALNAILGPKPQLLSDSKFEQQLVEMALAGLALPQA